MNTVRASYTNGNCHITLYDNGTRIIESQDDTMQLDYPLNVDIRVMTKCSLGRNPKTGKAFCAFCHESATTDGKECDYDLLLSKLQGLPPMELAIGGNAITDELVAFIKQVNKLGFTVNLTVNQLHVKKYSKQLTDLLEAREIGGLGISYRKSSNLYATVPEYFLTHHNVVAHVIAGIDSVEEVIHLPFQKVLVLGYKTFGFGVEYKDASVDASIKDWYVFVRKLMDHKEVVSFDNLALEQLNIKRFLSTEMWDQFYQGEHSMYINAVEGYYAPSSRSADKTDWNTLSLAEYFQTSELKDKD